MNLTDANLDLKGVASDLTMIFLLAQVIDDKIHDLEQKLRKSGNYKVEMKQYTSVLKNASRNMRNQYYKQLKPEEMDNFIQDVDSLSALLNNVVKDYQK